MKKVGKKIKSILKNHLNKIRYKICKLRIKKYMNEDIRGTSVSDEQEYPTFCRIAAKSDNIFKGFRRNIIYNSILEHVSKEMGRDYLLNIENDNIFTPEDWDNFSKNDFYGNPRLSKYYINGLNTKISPTTIRYIKVLKDIMLLFDTNKVKNIAEIGIGYAGQCRIITSYLNVEQYTLFDLPEVLNLSKKYLDKFGLSKNIRYEDGTNVKRDKVYDLVISNYAFSELIREIQEMYLEKVILKSKTGYITWNSLSYESLDGYSIAELLIKIPKSKIIKEEPLTSKNNCIIVWGNL